jgi:hypothetical protein
VKKYVDWLDIKASMFAKKVAFYRDMYNETGKIHYLKSFRRCEYARRTFSNAYLFETGRKLNDGDLKHHVSNEFSGILSLIQDKRNKISDKALINEIETLLKSKVKKPTQPFFLGYSGNCKHSAVYDFNLMED